MTSLENEKLISTTSINSTFSKPQSNTLRKPQWTYFHLHLVTLDNDESMLDVLTAKQHLTAALTRFLGLIGNSIEVDILKIESSNLWVRVPRETSIAFQEAISSWIGIDQIKYIVKAKSDWLVKVAMGSANSLF